MWKVTAHQVKEIAQACGFELAGIAAAVPHPDFGRYREWIAQGRHGAMSYLGGVRGDRRGDPRELLPSAKTIVCVGKLYNPDVPYSTDSDTPGEGWISRYAWDRDYHYSMRERLEQLACSMRRHADFEFKICVDTAPLLERSYARSAGLGWIGRNTCLIHEPLGSWFFLGELITSLDLEPDSPPADRCGTCTRCIEACPTRAIDDGGYSLDARLCISYLTIELRGAIPEELRPAVGGHVFGCDICQDVCPWNSRAPVAAEAAAQPAAALDEMAALSQAEWRDRFAATPVERARYSGFLRNVAVAMGNARDERFRAPLTSMAQNRDPLVAEHARWALERLG